MYVIVNFRLKMFLVTNFDDVFSSLMKDFK